MKKMLVGVIGLMALTGSAMADEVFLCTHGQKERVISVIYESQENKVPCEVRYKKDGVTETLWRAERETGYCEKKATAFVEKQKNWGWRCSNIESPGVTIQQNSTAMYQKLENNQQAQRQFIQTYTAIAPLRVMVTEYTMMNGKPPKSITELGLSEDDVNTSSYVKGLKMGEQGEIRVKGQQLDKAHLVIVLQPRKTLGGMNLEWKCTTNVRLYRGAECEYVEGLRF